MRREPEVPEEKCLDGHARITSNELAPIHSVKSGTRMLLQDKEWLQIWEKCSYAHRQVDDQLSKRSTENDDISAVAMLKKYNVHDRTGQTVINHERTFQHVVKRDPSKSFWLKVQTSSC